jgi:hypothetical protein
VSHQDAPEVAAARLLAAQTASLLGQAPAFSKLESHTRNAILRDLGTIQQALKTPIQAPKDPYALSLATPDDLVRRRFEAMRGGSTQPNPANVASQDTSTPNPKVAATETIAARAGALSDELDFPAFVAGLIHGTFDAIVDATIRQMEAFADLVSTVAKDVDQFTRENVTPNQVRDWLVQKHPNDLKINVISGRPQLRRVKAEDQEETSPEWLEGYGMAGEPLTDELLEERLVPAASRRVGEDRLQLLATMVLLGMNRVNIKDGSISARVMIRAAAKDRAVVDYAVSQDPGGASGWGARGGVAYDQQVTKVSTMGVNVQAESQLNAQMFGEVKINFVSETLPLERFADQAMMLLLQRNASRANTATPNATLNPSNPVIPVAAVLPTPTVAATPVPSAAPNSERR